MSEWGTECEWVSGVESANEWVSVQDFALQILTSIFINLVFFPYYCCYYAPGILTRLIFKLKRTKRSIYNRVFENIMIKLQIKFLWLHIGCEKKEEEFSMGPYLYMLEWSHMTAYHESGLALFYFEVCHLWYPDQVRTRFFGKGGEGICNANVNLLGLNCILILAATTMKYRAIVNERKIKIWFLIY